MSWHQVDITEKEDVEVVEKFGGPCRGWTYSPLIKSPDEDLLPDSQQNESSTKEEKSVTEMSSWIDRPRNAYCDCPNLF